MEKPYIYNFLNDDDLLRISNKIKEFEANTAGEICVSVKEERHLFEKNKNIRKLAEEEFFRRHVDKTRDKTGILIFLLLKDRQFFILADKGINEKVPPNTWDAIKDNMQEMFVRGYFAKGIIHGIEKVGKILAANFPIKPDDKDEISNKVNF